MPPKPAPKPTSARKSRSTSGGGLFSRSRSVAPMPLDPNNETLNKCYEYHMDKKNPKLEYINFSGDLLKSKYVNYKPEDAMFDAFRNIERGYNSNPVYLAKSMNDYNRKMINKYKVNPNAINQFPDFVKSPEAMQKILIERDSISEHNSRVAQSYMTPFNSNWQSAMGFNTS